MQRQSERLRDEAAAPDAADLLRQMISELDGQIGRQEKRVAKLSIDFGGHELRDAAKDLLADMIATRDSMAAQLQSIEEPDRQRSRS